MNDYNIIERLGKGGINKAFHAINKNDVLDYRVKEVLYDGFTEEDLTTIQNEVHVFTRLRHQNIIEYKNLFAGDDRFYIITEYVTGGTLAGLISQHPNGLPPERIKTILSQVIDVV
jgi:serine/threonine protein kinase